MQNSTKLPEFSMGKLLIFLGTILIITGLLFYLTEKILTGTHLPGDIVIHRKNLVVYIPLATSIIVSIILTLVLNLLGLIFFRK